MSLIMDATRAAQREKERREGGARAPVPVLVPLSKARPDFNWQRVSLLAIVGVSVVAAGVIIVQKTRNTVPRALRTPGPIVASIATPPPAADTTGAAGAAGTRTDSTPVVTTLQTAGADSAAAVAARSGVRPGTPRPAPRVSSRRSVLPTRPPEARVESAPAQGQFRIAVEHPREVEAARLFAAGVAAHRSGDLAAARAAYLQSLALIPTDADVLNNFGVLLTATREFDQAEATLRRAVSLAPMNAGAWNNLGTVMRERGRSAEAVAAFQRALAIDPRHDGARVSLAQQYLVIGSLAQARQLLDDVLAGNPSLPEASYALGQVLERLGDRPGAIRAYTTFMRVAPPGLAAYMEPVRRRVEALGAPAP